MINKYFGGEVFDAGVAEEVDDDLKAVATAAYAKFEKDMEASASPTRWARSSPSTAARTSISTRPLGSLAGFLFGTAVKLVLCGYFIWQFIAAF